MTATWAAPREWVNDELVTADLLNTHLRNNLEWLKDPPYGVFLADESSNYSTTSTSFANVDATTGKFTFDITVTEEIDTTRLLIGFSGTLIHSVAGVGVFFDVEVEGTRIGGDDGLVRIDPGQTGDPVSVSFVVLHEVTAAGTYTVNLQWKTSSGTATLYAGAGTSGADLHPQFWVREV